MIFYRQLRFYLFLILSSFVSIGVYAQETSIHLHVKSLSTSSLSVTWAGSADSFVIARSMNGTDFTDIATVNGNTYSYEDTDLSASAPYVYKIAAIRNGVKSEYTAASGAATKALATLPAITSDVSGVLSVQTENSNSSENSAKLLDDDVNTKYLFYATSGWVKFQFPQGAIVKQYALISANDSPTRDPKTWILEGSNDNSSWVALDQKTDQYFAGRYSKLQYELQNQNSFQYYRLTIQTNNGASMTQLSELKLYADCQTTRNTIAPNVPAALSTLSEMSKNGMVQIMPSSNQIILNWVDNSQNEDYFVLERSLDQQNWDWSAKIDKNNTRYRSVELTPLTKYYYRIKAVNDIGESSYSNVVSATTMSDVPSDSIVEDWDVHTATLYLQYYDDEIAIYYDKDMDPTITWPRTVFGGIWKYLKEVYGNYSDPRLYVYFHAGKYSGGHPSTWARSDHHYRNILDLGTSATTETAWQSFGGNNLDLPVHEIGHIMEGASLYVNGSPQRVIWGDSKFAEIFNYDVYVHNNLPDQAARWYNLQMANSDSTTPTSGIFWFRDFYYPIYSQYGGEKMLASFFVQMKKYLPQKNGDYTRDMNWGEFIHFYSIAAGVNLKAQATKAFGWSDEWETQFVKAQADFPSDYPNPPYDIMDEASAEANFEGTTSTTGYDKLFDQNYTTNYIADRSASTTTPFTITINGLAPTYLQSYSFVSAANENSTSQYDPADWKLYGQNGSADWTLIDDKTAQKFSARMEKKTIDLNMSQAYSNYKFEISKLNNPSAKKLYLAELEMKVLAADDVETGLNNTDINGVHLVSLMQNADQHPQNVLSVFSIEGKLIFKGSVTSQKWNSLLFNSKLPAGIYLYSYIENPGSLAQKGKFMVR